MDDSKYPAPVKLEPLLEAIEQVTKALDDAQSPRLKSAISELRDLAANRYKILCRRAHVFQDPDDPEHHKK